MSDSENTALSATVEQLISKYCNGATHRPEDYTVTPTDDLQAVNVSAKCYAATDLFAALQQMLKDEPEKFVALTFSRTWGLTSLMYATETRTIVFKTVPIVPGFVDVPEATPGDLIKNALTAPSTDANHA